MDRPIYEGGTYHVLSEKEISQIHETSIRVLENVGFGAVFTCPGNWFPGLSKWLPPSLFFTVVRRVKI